MNSASGALLDRLYNFHWVWPDRLARSAQAYVGFLAPFLRRHAIASVVNLRGGNPQFGWWRDEKRICEGLGVAHFDVMVSSRRLPPCALLAELFDAFDAARAPVLLKCSGGQDRTSFAAALYILHRKGASALIEAQAQFARWPYLHLPKRHQRWLALFPAYAVERAGGHAIADWVRDAYDPYDLAAWLEAKGLGDSFNGFQTVIRIEDA